MRNLNQLFLWGGIVNSNGILMYFMVRKTAFYNQKTPFSTFNPQHSTFNIQLLSPSPGSRGASLANSEHFAPMPCDMAMLPQHLCRVIKPIVPCYHAQGCWPTVRGIVLLEVWKAFGEFHKFYYFFLVSKTYRKVRVA